MKEASFWKSGDGRLLQAIGIVVGPFVLLGILTSHSSTPVPVQAAPADASAVVTRADRPTPAIHHQQTARPRRHRKRGSRPAMSDASVLALLATQGLTCELEDSPLSTGEARRMAKLPGCSALIELIGPPDDLRSISVALLSPLDGGDVARLNGAYAGLFLRAYAPHAVDWTSAKILQQCARSDGGSAHCRSDRRRISVTTVPAVDTLWTTVTIKRDG